MPFRLFGPRYIPPHLQGDREIHANDPSANEQFVDNIVITMESFHCLHLPVRRLRSSSSSNDLRSSKYTWYNFVPVFLLEQFARFANFYFLVVSVMQTIPAISITNGVPTNFLPLSVVLLFDGVVTAREDYKRHKDDHKANSSKTMAMRGGKFIETTWADVRVGDVLKLLRNTAVPADCLFLSAYSPDSPTPDTCYVQTAQLDGETNLKLRKAVQASAERFKSDGDCASFHGRVVCEAPNASFDKFVGMLHMGTGGGGGGTAGTTHGGPGSGSTSVSPTTAADHAEQGIAMVPLGTRGAGGGVPPAPVPLEAEQILLRGSVLRNVDHAYAMVVYTGRESKVRVRQTTRPVKRPQVETMLNTLISVLVAILVIICTAGAIGATIWNNAHTVAEGTWYLHLRPMTVLRGVEQACTYFLLNASFIPVSLYVTVRLARSFQTVFMQWDADMYHCEPELLAASGGLEGEYPFRVRTMDLNDELGQITHIFSDKTGTLTLNYMEFRKLLVNGVAYGLGTTQIGVDRLRREGHDVRQLEAALLSEAERSKHNVGAGLPHVNFEDGSETHAGHSLARDSADPKDGGQGTAVHDFLLHLSLNHTVLPEVVRDSGGTIIGSRLSASSPDEEAFLFATQSFGYVFSSRTHETITIACKWPVQALPLQVAPPGAITAAMLQHTAVATKPPTRPPSGTDANTPAPLSRLLFRVHHILAYTQERKRMSVLVEHPVYDPGTGSAVGCTGHGTVVLYCKGADSTILPRLRAPVDEVEADRIKRTKRQLAEWGNDGLRTLVFAYRVVPAAEFKAFAAKFAAACTNLEEVRKRKNKQKNIIDDLQDEMEKGLVLQGATANEDKLQPEVPETIALLARGGVKLWMVTGDKQETAVNIGFATKLLDDTMRQVVVTAESAGSVSAALKRLRVAAKRMRAERGADKEARLHGGMRTDRQGATNMQSATVWLRQQLESIEATLGLDAQRDKAVEIDIDATAAANDAGSGKRARAATGEKEGEGFLRTLTRLRSVGAMNSKQQSSGGSDAGSASGSPTPRGADTPTSPAPPPAPVPKPVQASLTELAARERAISYASEEGEEAEALFDAPVHHVPAPAPGSAPPFAVVQGEGLGLAQGKTAGRTAVPTPLAPSPAAGPQASEPAKEHASQAAIKYASSLLAQPLSLATQRRPFALVIDEPCLDAALAHPRAKAYLLYVAVNCSAVIACRARPDQKAQVVRLIRHGVPTSRTLAVGDGANDVDMIGNAHVGVGIAGAEGVQAANASDYSIGRFRFLQRLLLVHGRWNYGRMSKLVLYMFWKNLVLVFTQFVFQWHNGFSGQKWYIEYAAQVYNLLYTGLPVLLMAVYDRDVEDHVALKYPKLYDFGRLNRGLNLQTFLLWLLDGFATALVIAFFTLHGFLHPHSLPQGGHDPFAGSTPFVFTMGTAALTSVITTVSFRMAAETNYHHWFFQVGLAGSVLLWPISCFVFDAMSQDGMQGGMRHVWTSAAFYLTVLLITGLFCARLAFWKAWRRAFTPTFSSVIQEASYLGCGWGSIEEYADAADMARKTGRSLAEVLDAGKLASAAAKALAPAIAAHTKISSATGFTAHHQRALMAERAAQGEAPLLQAVPAGKSSVSSTADKTQMPLVGTQSGEDASAREGRAVSPALAASAVTIPPAMPPATLRPGFADFTAGSSSAGGASGAGERGGLVSPGTLTHTQQATYRRILEAALGPRHMTMDELTGDVVAPDANFDAETASELAPALARARAQGGGAGAAGAARAGGGGHGRTSTTTTLHDLTASLESAMGVLRSRLTHTPNHGRGKDERQQNPLSPGSPVPSLPQFRHHHSASMVVRGAALRPDHHPAPPAPAHLATYASPLRAGNGAARRRGSLGDQHEVHNSVGRAVSRAEAVVAASTAVAHPGARENTMPRQVLPRSFEAEDAPTIQRLLVTMPTLTSPQSSAGRSEVGLPSSPGMHVRGAEGERAAAEVGFRTPASSPGRATARVPGRQQLLQVLASVDGAARGSLRLYHPPAPSLAGGSVEPSGAGVGALQAQHGSLLPSGGAAFSVDESAAAYVARHFSTYGQLLAASEESLKASQAESQGQGSKGER